MDAHFPPAVHSKRRRRGLFDPFSDLFPPASTKDSITSTSASTDALSTSSTTTNPITSTSGSASTSTTSSTTSTSSTSSTTSAPSTSQFVQSTTTVIPSSIITVTQTPTLPTTTSTSDGPTNTAVNATTQPQGFLQNKVLSGIVFALVGIIGLAVLVSVATFALRRSRKKRLINEALSFDPVDMESNEEMTIEKGRRPVRDRSSSSTGHTTVYGVDQPIYANGYSAAYATPVPYASPQAPYGFGPNQQINSSSTYMHQPYTQQFDWTGAPVQEGHSPNPEEHGAPQHRKSRRSQSSSSGDFQFAAVTPPPGIPGVRR